MLWHKFHYVMSQEICPYPIHNQQFNMKVQYTLRCVLTLKWLILFTLNKCQKFSVSILQLSHSTSNKKRVIFTFISDTHTLSATKPQSSIL